jgi:transcriptional regulator with XRE-family HTH domain
MIFSRQIRAARAMIELKQDELAIVAGVSLTTIQRLESGEEGNAKTQAKIRKALQSLGVSFTEKGIVWDEFPVLFTYGTTHEEAYLQLISDAHEHLKTVKNPELLIMYADDQVSPPSVNEKYRAMRKDGIKMRQLIKKGNEYIIGPLDEYRYIPEKFFANRVTLIYGNRIANETADVLRGIIRVDPLNADIQRNTFNMLWDMLQKPEKSISDERFE